jgi:DNA-binding NarL/FixJ family response regulator
MDVRDFGTRVKGPACVLVNDWSSGEALQVLELLSIHSPLTPCIILLANLQSAESLQWAQYRPLAVVSIHCDEKFLLDLIELGVGQHQRLLDAEDHFCRYRQVLGQLTDRQTEVLELILTGLPNKLVAVNLDVSERTVECERSRLLGSFEVGSIVELAEAIGRYRAISAIGKLENASTLIEGPPSRFGV